MEAMAHHPVMHHIGNGYQGHALVMGHVATHYGNPLAFRKPDRGEVERFIETKAAHCAFLFQALEVFHGGMREVHRGQSCGVRGNHQIFAESSLHPQAGYAKSSILIGKV